MSNPRLKKSPDAQQADAVGDRVRANGHYHVTVFVAVDALDTAAGDTLTVKMEGSPDGDRWDTIDDDQGNPISIAEGDLDEDPDSGEDTASLTHRGAYYEFYRLRLGNYNDAANGDLVVDGYVMAAGNAGSGARGLPDSV